MNTNEFKSAYQSGRRDFSHEQLTQLNLSWQNLSEANFEGANLSHSNLNTATLTQVNFRHADLTFVNLSGSNLTNADFRSANLEGANLSGTILTGMLYDSHTIFPHGIDTETLQLRIQAIAQPLASPSPSSATREIPQSLHSPVAESVVESAVEPVVEPFPENSSPKPEASLGDSLLDPAPSSSSPEDLTDLENALALTQPPAIASEIVTASAPKDARSRLGIVQDWYESLPMQCGAAITTIAFSANAKLLACGCLDSHVRLWDMTTQTLLYTFIGQPQGILAIAMSPDQKLMASGAGNGTITLWNLESKQLYKTLVSSSYAANAALTNQPILQALNLSEFEISHQLAVSAIAFFPTGDRLIAGYADGTLRIWNLQTGREMKAQKVHQSAILQIQFSQNGTVLVTGGCDRLVKVLSPDLQQTYYSHSSEEGWVCAAAITPDHQFVLSGLNTGKIYVWNLPKQRKQYILDTAHDPGLMSLHVIPEKMLMISVGQDHFVKFWHLHTGRFLGSLTGSYPASLSQDHQHLATIKHNSRIHVFKNIAQPR